MTDVDLLSDAEHESLLPRVLPAGWKRSAWPIPAFDNMGMGELRGIRVLFSATIESDGQKWIHVSVSRPSRIPTWSDMDAIRRLFIGPERWAYEIHPPAAKHYDNSQDLPPGLRVGMVLHLWARVDGTACLPDFAAARGGRL